LLIERFDVRRTSRDRRMWALEDFCSVLDLPSAAKYDGTIERCARALRALSTNPAADLDTLLRRAIFAWLIADGDMHLKNLALLKVARPQTHTFESVRLAPLYDSVSTRVFPRFAADRTALRLNGKDDRLTRADFLAAARTMGLSDRSAEAACEEVSMRVATHARKLRLPAFVRRQAKSMQDALLTIVEKRVDGLR
jgi:serine/threonine-protein kinase HipA